MIVNISNIEMQLKEVEKVAMQIHEDESAPKKWRENAIKSYMQIKSAVDTYKQSQHLFVENARKNRTLDYTNICDFKRKYEGKSILSVAFGSSLSEDIEKVKHYAKKMPVICSDTAFKWLCNKGVLPRYVCVLDARTHKKYVPKIDMSGVTIFANIGASHDYIYECFINGAEIVFFTCDCRINSHLELAEISNIKESLPISGNVSFGQDYICLSVMNCNKLYIAGHDYCFNRMYYPNQEYTGDISKQLEEKKIFSVYEQNGTVSYTNRQMILYRDFFRDYLYSNNLAEKVYNISNFGICDYVRRLRA